jgi:PAS domain S-box-containing protein
MEDVLAPLSHAVLVIDGDGRLAFMNPAAEETLGLESDDVLGLHYSELPWRPLDDDGSHMAMADRPITRILAGSQEAFRLQRAEVEYRDGSRATLLLDGGPIREEDGSLAGVVVAFTDVTEQLRTERALRQSEERYRQLFANMNECVALHEMVYDEAGVPGNYVVRDVNVVLEDIVGVSRSEAAGRRATDLYGTAAHKICV